MKLLNSLALGLGLVNPLPYRPFTDTGSPASPLADTQQGLEAWADTVEGLKAPLLISKGTEEDFPIVIGLIGKARKWLGTIGTDQWATPWPDEDARDERVRAGLRNGKTWMVRHRGVAVATITIATRRNAAVWQTPYCTCDLGERAVFVHRLIVDRDAGWPGLGAELIDWAGRRGRRLYGAKYIRIDVWTGNKGLHNYYLATGFEPCGECPDPEYPSGALFQKPVAAIPAPSHPMFTEFPGLVDPELQLAGRIQAGSVEAHHQRHSDP